MRWPGLHSRAARISDRGTFVCPSINRYYSGRRTRFNDKCLQFAEAKSHRPDAILPELEMTIMITLNESALTFFFFVHYTQTSTFISDSPSALGADHRRE